jgi:hypothetical protein
MRKLIVVFLAGCVLCACEEPKEELIDFNEIAPQSEKYKDGENSKPDSVEQPDFGFDLHLARELGIEVMQLDSFPEPMFPDRFVPRSIQKMTLQLKEDAIFFGQWVYKDSIKTMNALFNWMDCFGPKCKSLKYLQPTNFQKESMLIFVNDTSLTYISSPLKLDKNQWQQYLEKNKGTTEWDIVIVQKKAAKASWEYYGSLNGSDKKQFLPLME